MQQAKAGLDSVYLSGWQVAGDANNSLEMYPDQSLYAAKNLYKQYEKNIQIRCSRIIALLLLIGKQN